MTSTKHTPGPWKRNIADPMQIVAEDMDAGKIIGLADKPRKMLICRISDGVKYAPHDANACLIEQAPALLRLAEKFLASIDYQIAKDRKNGDDEGANLKSFTRKECADIIAKAKGE